MRVLDKVCLRLRSLTRRANLDRELDEEFRFHLDQLVDENMAAGMTADEARIAAIRAIGGISQFQEECRDMRRTNYIHDGLRISATPGAICSGVEAFHVSPFS